MLESQKKRIRRHKRVRAKIHGTKERPRLCVFRSNLHIYAQIIDDQKQNTIISVNDSDLKKAGIKIEKKEGLTSKAAIAKAVGNLIAKKSVEEKIEKVVFDRGGYKYHGVIKALADGAREGGLKF